MYPGFQSRNPAEPQRCVVRRKIRCWGCAYFGLNEGFDVCFHRLVINNSTERGRRINSLTVVSARSSRLLPPFVAATLVKRIDDNDNRSNDFYFWDWTNKQLRGLKRHWNTRSISLHCIEPFSESLIRATCRHTRRPVFSHGMCSDSSPGVCIHSSISFRTSECRESKLSFHPRKSSSR